GASGVEMGASAPPEVPLSLQPPVASPVATTMLRMPGNAGAIFMGRKLTGRRTETQTSRDRQRASWRAGARSWVGRHPRGGGDLDPAEPGPERGDERVAADGHDLGRRHRQERDQVLVVVDAEVERVGRTVNPRLGRGAVVLGAEEVVPAAAPHDERALGG